MRIVQRLLALAGIAVVVWVCVTSWGAVLHGHPLYAVLLGLTLVGAIALGVWSFRAPGEPDPHLDKHRARRRAWRISLSILGIVVAVAWLAAIAWLKPFSAVQPALAAMQPSETVTVTETATQIVMAPALDAAPTGVLFQPGAKVDARAYAAVLRPLAEAGYTVVIPKQPLGIAFLAAGAFEAARDQFPDITQWIVGGHSLGGTVAAMDAEEHGADVTAPAAGLLLYASYPASDMSSTLASTVLSVSGTNDGLATLADIQASVADLPAEATFLAINGAAHSSFGDYGLQPGDGTPSISQDDARDQISAATVEFAGSL